MGGAWCYDIDSCNLRWQQTPQLMTNKYWSQTISVTGIFDDNITLNAMANAYKVYLPYCSSDAWMGSRTASNMTSNFTFYGQHIIEAVFETLIENDTFPFFDNSGMQDIVYFGGCSAGARGAMANLDYIPSIIEHGLKKRSYKINDGIKLKMETKNIEKIIVYGVLDSALWMNVQPLNLTLQPLSLANQTQKNYQFVNATGRVYGSECYKYYNDTNQNNDAWKCILGQYRIPLLSLPHFVNNAQYDAYSLSYNLGNNDNIDMYTAQDYNYAENPFKSTFRSIVLHNIDSNIFSSACFHHCTSEESLFWNLTINGHSFASTVGIFMQQTSLNEILLDEITSVTAMTRNKWIDNCTDNYINCGSGCASAENPY